MMTVVFFIALGVSATPFIATGIVSMASVREDSDFTLGHPAAGPVPAIARRILDFRSDVTDSHLTKASRH